MQESMRFYHVAHSMKRIEILLSYIKDKNKFKKRDFISFRLMFQDYFLLYFLFNILRLLWGLWPKVTSWALGPSEDASLFEEATWLRRSMLSLSRETKKKGPRRNSSSDTENPKQRYVQATEAHPLNT